MSVYETMDLSIDEAYDLLVSEFAHREAEAREKGERIIAIEWKEEIEAADKQRMAAQASHDEAVIEEWLGRYTNLIGN